MAMEKSSSEGQDGKMTTCQTVTHLINMVIGVGVLFVPFAFSVANYWAVALLVLGVGIMTFTAYLIGEALKMAGRLDDAAVNRNFIYLAEISYGPCGKMVVRIITVMEVWGSAVACLVMSGSNIHSVLGLSKPLAVLVCTMVSSMMMFIPLGIYAYLSAVSMLAMLIGSSCFVGELFAMTNEWSFPDFQFGAGLGNLFRAYGLFLLCFAGHPLLPSFHDGMQHPKRWTACVFGSFAVAMVFYLAVGLAAFLAKGQNVHAIFTADVAHPWLKTITVALFAVKIQLTIPLLLRVLMSSLEQWPSCGNVKDMLQSSWPVALVVLITAASAFSLAKQEAALASVTGAFLMNATCVIIPIMMYAKLSLRLASWSQQPFKNKAKLVTCCVVLIFGFITAVGGTYTAVLDMQH